MLGAFDNSREPLESSNYISGATKFIAIQRRDKRIVCMYIRVAIRKMDEQKKRGDSSRRGVTRRHAVVADEET